MLNNSLQSYGLLCHTFAFNELPASLQKKLAQVCDVQLEDQYLSLLANAGKAFWTSMKQTGIEVVKTSNIDLQKTDTQHNPVDDYSTTIAKEILELTQLSEGAEILYPNRFSVPLMELGEHAGWSTPSPLGLGLHNKFGPWFAYRALIKTTHPLQAIEKTTASKPNTQACLTCVSTPCVTACPAGAVSLSNRFSISQCADYRVLEKSTCTEQCHARNACPEGSSYQYSEEQRSYHMTQALSALIKWSANAK